MTAPQGPVSAALAHSLGQCGVFSDLDATALESLAAGSDVRDLADGEVVFDCETPVDAACLVLAGEVAIVPSAAEAGSVLTVRRAGDLLDKTVFRGKATHGTAAIAAGPGRLCHIPGACLRTLRDRVPDALFAALFRIAAADRGLLMDTLRGSAAFGHLPQPLLDWAAAAMDLELVPAGRAVFDAGAASDHLYLVVNGGFVVQATTGLDALPLHTLGRGAVFGAVDVIFGQPRGASVRAVRDSMLAVLHREALEDLLRAFPVEMSRATAAMVREHVPGGPVPGPARARGSAGSRTLAMMAISPGVEVRPLAETLREQMACHGATVVLDAARAQALSAMDWDNDESFEDMASAPLITLLNVLESTHRHMILVCDSADTSWTRRCLRHADRILMVADATTAPEPGPLETALVRSRQAGLTVEADLVLLQPAGIKTASGTAAWLAPRPGTRHHHLRKHDAGDIARLGRVLTGNAVGLVLGAGGARGFSQIGVLRAMQEIGVPIDMVGGSSIGAFIGSLVALGWDIDRLCDRVSEAVRRSAELPTLPLVSLFSGRRARREAQRAFGDVQIEDMPIPFFSVSSNLSKACQEVLDAGSLRVAVSASNTAPGVYPPFPHARGMLVDGAFINSVPVDVMAPRTLGGPVIAVNVSPGSERQHRPGYDEALSGWEVLRHRIGPRSHPVDVPGIVEILTRISNLGGLMTQEREVERHATLCIVPPVNHFSIMDYGKGADMVEVGYRDALPILSRWQAEAGS